MAFDLRGRYALVTGASSGIGLEIARGLGARGAHLILAARRRDQLDEIAASIGRSNSINIQVVDVDLAHPEGPRTLIEMIDEEESPIDILVNNAGVGLFGDGLDADWQREEAMLRLNVLAVAHLTKHYGRSMRLRGAGRILQISSTAAFQPCPGYAAYAATKAFVLLHAEALAEELRDSGVTITAVCPGSTNTEFFEISGHERNQLQEATSLEPAEVARLAIDAMLKGRRVKVTGAVNALSAFGVRFLPRRWQASLTRRVLS
ncbi:putative oxidoreductase [Planctomycetes bacterium Poly30]|uniref:Putative oxidoreductase n=1 Tax=Saltatorellus ferox TaxID=2528018 RepID=A0A518F0G1_9BACT|nr:putative oxidoreductase [Planctomycetes bacterium Poly30]